MTTTNIVKGGMVVEITVKNEVHDDNGKTYNSMDEFYELTGITDPNPGSTGNYKAFPPGHHVESWTCGDTISGKLKYQLITSHGIFNVCSNDSFKAINYTSPLLGDPDNANCSNVDHFTKELEKCGIVIKHYSKFFEMN